MKAALIRLKINTQVMKNNPLLCYNWGMGSVEGSSSDIS
jgi:hypothetical protein